MRSLLQIVTAACDELGLPRPSSVVSSTGQTERLMLSLANREGFESARISGPNDGWPELRKEYSFTTQTTGLITGCSYTANSNIVTIGTPPTQAPQVGWVISASGGSNSTGFPYPTYVTGVAGNQITVSSNSTISVTNSSIAFGQESYSIPTDLAHIINQTEWDRGYRWQMAGPVSPQEWQVLKSGLSPTGPRRRFRIMSGKFFIDPIPFDTNLIVYEYYSNAFCMSSDGLTPKSLFSADTDVPVISDEIFISGLKWRFRASQGLDYSEEKKTYQDTIRMLIGYAGAARTLSMNNSSYDGLRFLSNDNIPDTGFGK